MRRSITGPSKAEGAAYRPLCTNDVVSTASSPSGNVFTLQKKEDESDRPFPSGWSLRCGRRAISATSPALLYCGSIQMLRLHSVDINVRYILATLEKICTTCFDIKLLNTKCRLLYLKTQFVQRSKYFSSRL